MRKSLAEKLARATKDDTEVCWPWPGNVSQDGYGLVIHNGKRVRVHRAVLGFPDGVVMHTCDNRLCVNPNHLCVGTLADNNHDMVAKGRQNNQRKTHCKQGHLLAGDNLYNRPGRRACKKCARERTAEHHRRYR